MEERKYLIEMFVHSVYVFDDWNYSVFLNYRGHIGGFLNKSGVRLLSPMVHQMRYQKNCVYVDDDVFGFSINAADYLKKYSHRRVS